MICIPIAAETNEQMLALIARAEREPADLYEYRFDSMSEAPEVERLLAAATRPVMATCRSVNEGGGFRGGFADRRAVLRRAGVAGAAYIDSETGDLESLDDCGGAVRIVSMHDFDHTPADLDRRVAALAATRAEWVKFAVTARSHADNLRLFASLAKCPKPAIAIAMGPKGVPSRILGGRFGSRVTFGSLDAGLESAPGQTTARELSELYRVRSITPATELHGFLGDIDRPAAGHVADNRAFAEAGMDAVCVPFLADDAEEFLSSIPDALALRRLTVDARHAAAALAWADDDDARAARTGKATVLIRENGRWLADDSEPHPPGKPAAMRSPDARS